MPVTIDQIRSLGDFLPIYKWDVQISKVPSGVSITSDDLNFRVLTSDLPKMTGTSIEVNIKGHKVKQPGIYNYSNTLNMTFAETVDAKILTFIKEWRELCWETKTGKQKKKEEAEAEFLMFLLDREDNAVWKFRLVGCYLEDYDLTGLDGSSSDIQRPSIIISYDYFEDEKV